MQTEAVRVYGKSDLRLDIFDLPPIEEDEILFEVVVDSICMSTYKIAIQGEEHKKVPNDIKDHPVIVGHEIAGNIISIGKKWRDKYDVSKKYVVQPNIPKGTKYPGYSMEHCGGDATYIVLPAIIMEEDCLIPFSGESYFEGALTEPLSCVIGAYNANYHQKKNTHYHEYGIKKDGNVLIMGGTGPMGLFGIDCAINHLNTPKNVVVTDIDAGKLARAEKLYPKNEQTNIAYVNTKEIENQAEYLMELVDGKYDDIFIFAPVEQLISVGDQVLNDDGCLNLFAGPSDKEFSADVNFYNVHYRNTHYVGTSGGTLSDAMDAVKMIEQRKVDVAKVVTHVLGLKDAAKVTLEQAAIGGGKKLVYPHCDLPFTSLEKLMTEDSPLAEILKQNDELWSKEAEQYLLKNYKK